MAKNGKLRGAWPFGSAGGRSFGVQGVFGVGFEKWVARCHNESDCQTLVQQLTMLGL